MGVDIIAFLEAKGIYLIIFIVLLIIFIIVLSLINKNLKKKIILKEIEEEKDDVLLKEIEALRMSKEEPKIILESINSTARNFLAENFNVDKNLDYSEIITLFKEKNNNKIIFFCEQMLEALYSGEKVNSRKINGIISSLEAIAEEIHPGIKQIKDKISIEMPKEPILIKKEASKIPIKLERPAITPLALKTLPIMKQGVYEPKEMNYRLDKTDEEPIRTAYKELQKKFEQAYNIAEKNNIKESIEKLDMFREEVKTIVEEYAKDNSKIMGLAKEISRGARLLRLQSGI